ncbi:hypothetical protein Q9233_011736 [Columba guinea]|nr:hypothetical protein Q9233_011736 [Columba guinea]
MPTPVCFSLFQSTDMSPASSTASLPVSPLPEEPAFFKVFGTINKTVFSERFLVEEELITQTAVVLSAFGYVRLPGFTVEQTGKSHSAHKDGIKDECSVLKLQLKERDELIAQLHEELEKAQCLQKALASQADKSTQTELIGHDALWNSPCSEGLVYKPISISLVPSLVN